ncbi:MAG: pyridoxamine 5'-phosphate oxidase family protein [Actinomycetota bacterium]|nr:pyridoxamine 5'-phosphate oxidase family protein [Actinomycetota bacterium]
MDTRRKQPIIPEGYGELLGSTALARVATKGPHGEPQSNPIWFDWDREQSILPVRARQKYRNLNRDPRIALSLVNPEVVRIDEDLGLNCINSMTKKNLGMGKYPYHQPADKRVVIFMRPEHTTQMGV